MTVTAIVRRSDPAIGDGSNLNFPFPFKTFNQEEVAVFVLDPVTNVETRAVFGVDFSVTLNADQNDDPGGTAVFAVPPAVGEIVVVAGDVPYDQQTALPDGGRYRAESVETALDRLAVQAQQLAEEVSRAAKVPVTTGDADALNAAIAALSTNLANLLIATNNIGDIITVAGDITDINTLAAISPQVVTVAGIAPSVVAVDVNELNVNTVAGSIANVNTVAGSIASVNAVAGSIADVSAVAPIVSDVVVTAANIAVIQSAAENAANAEASATAAAVSANAAAASAAVINPASFVQVTGNQTIGGIKTFSSTPRAPGLVLSPAPGNDNGVYAGNGDASSSTQANLQIRSWFGIGFSPSISGMPVPQNENAVWIDARTGNLSARGIIVAGDHLRSDTITNGAGTGAPNFPNGLRLNTNAVLGPVTGNAPMFACRAWVNFDGTTMVPTIRASGNVSSVTRNGAGRYTVNFITAMPDAGYSAVAFTQWGGGPYVIGARDGAASYLASSIQITTGHVNGMDTNINAISVAIFR